MKKVMMSTLLIVLFGFISQPGFSETNEAIQQAQKRQILRILGLFPEQVVNETLDQIASGQDSVITAPNLDKATKIESHLLSNPMIGAREETTCEYFGCPNYCVGDANWNYYKCGNMGCTGKQCDDTGSKPLDPVETQGR